MTSADALSLRIQTLDYDPGAEAFHADVIQRRPDETVHIAASFQAPMTTDPDLVKQGLLADAGRILAGGHGLLMRNRAYVASPTAAAA